MKRFLYRLALFFLLFTIVLLGLDFGIRFKVSNDRYFKLDTNIHYLFLGHSHSECAYNDTVIDNSLNLSNSGEPYLYTFIKLKKLLASQHNLKAVFLEYTNNVIDEEMNQWMYESKYLNFRYPKYGSFFSLNDYLTIAKHNPRSLLTSEAVLLKSNISFLLGNSDRYYKQNDWGSYEYLMADNLSKNLEKLQASKDSLTSKREPSVENIRYLKEIVQLASHFNVKLYFIRTPMSSLYTRSNEKAFLKLYKSDFQDVEFIDLKEFIKEDEYFSDLEHLNYRGSVFYSQKIDSLIKNDQIRDFKLKF